MNKMSVATKLLLGGLALAAILFAAVFLAAVWPRASAGHAAAVTAVTVAPPGPGTGLSAEDLQRLDKAYGQILASLNPEIGESLYQAYPKRVAAALAGAWKWPQN